MPYNTADLISLLEENREVLEEGGYSESLYDTVAEIIGLAKRKRDKPETAWSFENFPRPDEDLPRPRPQRTSTPPGMRPPGQHLRDMSERLIPPDRPAQPSEVDDDPFAPAETPGKKTSARLGGLRFGIPGRKPAPKRQEAPDLKEDW